MKTYFNKNIDYLEIQKIANITIDKEFLNYNLNLLFIEKGSLDIKVSDEIFTLNEKSIFIINTFESYKFIKKHSKELIVYKISLDLIKLSSLEYTPFKKRVLIPLEKILIKNTDIFNDLLNFCKSFTTKEPSYIKLHYNLQLILTDILESISINAKTSHKECELLYKIFHYIKIKILGASPTAVRSSCVTAKHKCFTSQARYFSSHI